MPVPWLKIVQLMPSILDVSRELLKRTRRSPSSETAAAVSGPSGTPALDARVGALEDNERRQAELVTTMADQLAQLTAAVTALHSQARRLLIGQVATAVIAVIAVVFAVRA
jgi:hypothetical protein